MSEIFNQAQLLLGIPDVDEQQYALTIKSLDDFLKEKQIEHNSEYSDNIWRLKSSLELKRDYAKVFSLLKEKKHYDAWGLLEICEINLSLIIENSNPDFHKEARLHFYSEYISNWQSLFPYAIFFSPGMLVGYYTCSICNTKIRPRNSCKHKKKKLYCGEICFHNGHDLEMLEISIVTKPVQKYSVVMKDYDYTVVNYVVERLNSPFDGWQPIRTRKIYPRNMFNSAMPETTCPCKQGDKKFSECCSPKAQIEIPHIDIVFAKALPQELCCEIFPY